MKTLAGIVSFALVALGANNAFAQYPPAAYPPPPSYPPAPGYPPPGFAPPRPRFGNAGILAISAEANGAFAFSSVSHPSSAATSDVALSLRPSADYFVIQGLSVGGFIDFAWDKPKGGDASTTIGFGPTVGYNLWISPDQLSLWPKLTIAFDSTSASFTTTTPAATGTTSTTTSTSVTETKFNLGIFVPLLIHPAEHFFFGVGPFFSTDLSSKASSGSTSTDGDKVTTVGVKFEIGGWLGPF